jgi:two-component system LytT family response regulator
MKKCVIIDDEQPAIDVLVNYVKQMPGLVLVGTATNPLIGIEMIKRNNADVVFLDIQMDEMSGIDVIKIIGSKTKVIFCTAYGEFAVASYDLDATDYLMKPIAFSRFVKAVQRIVDEPTAVENPSLDASVSSDYIFVKTEQKGKMLKIDLDDIDFIEAMSNYITFHRGKQKTMAYSTMKELEGRLQSYRFMRVHKSYIVSIKKISAIENGDIILKDRTERIPLSNSYKDAFMDLMKYKIMNNQL